MAVRRKMSSFWKPSGPISFHQERKFGCQASSARWSRLSLERSTLFGIFVSLTTVDIALSSGPVPVEFGTLRLAVERERAALADRVRSLEDPVLPRRQAREDLRFHRLWSGEAERGLHAGHGVRRHGCALLE